MELTVSRYRKRISRAWYPVVIVLFLLILGQSIGGTIYEDKTLLAWLWWGVVTIPMTGMLLSALVLRDRIRTRRVDRNFYLLTLTLIILYGLTALGAILSQPQLPIPPIQVLVNFLYGLVPLQIFILTLTGIAFYRLGLAEKGAFTGPVRAVLFLGANPKNSTRIRIDEEIREIDEELSRGRERDQFDLKSKFAVTSETLIQALLDTEPAIVHFSGHGSGSPTGADIPGNRDLEWDEGEGESGGLALEDEQGNIKLVSGDSLANLFRQFRDTVECVILNACYSETQAKAIARHIPYVIGMNRAVPDQTAIAFAIGFYKALGAGKDIEFAYEMGKNAVDLSGLQGKQIPQLLKNGEPVKAS